jgi:hypothetical protein
MSKEQGKNTYDPTPNLTNIGKGRKRGVPNKTTALLKDAILKAAEATGEDREGKDGLVGYCTYLAKDEPKAFTQLLGRVLPIQVQGDKENPLHAVIEWRAVKAKG